MRIPHTFIIFNFPNNEQHISERKRKYSFFSTFLLPGNRMRNFRCEFIKCIFEGGKFVVHLLNTAINAC